MDISTPPSLDLACPQAKTEIEKHVHMLRERGVDKNKIRTLKHHVHYYNINKLKHKTFYHRTFIIDFS